MEVSDTWGPALARVLAAEQAPLEQLDEMGGMLGGKGFQKFHSASEASENFSIFWLKQTHTQTYPLLSDLHTQQIFTTK